MNAKDINQTFDLAAIIPDLKPKGAFEIGPCPFCGGKDRFNVKHTPDGDRWWCRKCGGGKYQTPIDYVMRRDGLDFKAALQRMGGDLSSLPAAPRPERIPEPALAPVTDWQAAAFDIMDTCRELLHSEQGYNARRWLTGPTRRLTPAAIDTWDLGYSPGMTIRGVYVERGILIPCWEGKDVWYLKVRRPTGEPKYRKIKGSKPGLFGACTARDARVIFVTEGEFDAMQLWSAICSLPGTVDVGVITAGSATDRIDPVTWGGYLLTAEYVLAVYDMDDAGMQGYQRLAALTNTVRRASLPETVGSQPVKDVTDYVRAGGDLAAWVNYQLESLSTMEIV